MPQGVNRGGEIDLTDRCYDGIEESNRLKGGLGQLLDGKKGADNFRADNGLGKGKCIILCTFGISSLILRQPINRNVASHI